jgi:hypothetical protein
MRYRGANEAKTEGIVQLWNIILAHQAAKAAEQD